MPLRPALFALASSAALMLTAPTARANPDPAAKPTCTENCVDAGYEWAEKHSLAGPEDCASDNEDFTAGCAHYLEEKQLALEPAPEEPAEAAEYTDAESADAAEPADEGMEATAADEVEASDQTAPVDPPQD